MRKISASLLAKLNIASRIYNQNFTDSFQDREYPETIPGLLINFDASRVDSKTLSTAEIIQWRNLGNLGAFASPLDTETGPTNVAAGQNSLDYAQFNDNPMELVGPFINATDITAFFVGANTRGDGDLLNAVDSVIDARTLSSPFNGFWIETFNYFADETQRMVTMFGNTGDGGGERDYWKNGTYVGEGDGNEPTIAEDEWVVAAGRLNNLLTAPAEIPINFGVQANNAFTAQNDVGQVLIYSSLLSDSTIVAISEFLMEKWGVS